MSLQVLVDFLMAVSDLLILFEFLLQNIVFLSLMFDVLSKVLMTDFVGKKVLITARSSLDILGKLSHLDLYLFLAGLDA